MIGSTCSAAQVYQSWWYFG